MSLAENLWGTAKRLQFIDDCLIHRFTENRQAVHLLDIGCGNGTGLAIPLAERGYRVFGVDPHAKSISCAVKLAPPSATFVCGRLSDVPPQRFHAIIISEVLEHLDDPDNLLRASISYLAHSGVLIITVPNGYGEFEIDSYLYRNLHLSVAFDFVRDFLRRLGRHTDPATPGSYDTSGHVQRFTLSRLRRMFAANNLRIIHSRGSSFASGPLVAHTLGHSARLVRLNARLADLLPLWACSGWFLASERIESAKKSAVR